MSRVVTFRISAWPSEATSLRWRPWRLSESRNASAVSPVVTTSSTSTKLRCGRRSQRLRALPRPPQSGQVRVSCQYLPFLAAFVVDRGVAHPLNHSTAEFRRKFLRENERDEIHPAGGRCDKKNVFAAAEVLKVGSVSGSGRRTQRPTLPDSLARAESPSLSLSHQPGRTMCCNRLGGSCRGIYRRLWRASAGHGSGR